MNMFSKTSRISLNLIEPTLYIDTDSDSYNVVRGVISFDIAKKTSISTLIVHFNGKMETKTHRFDLFSSMPNQKKTLTSQKLAIHPMVGQSASEPLVLNPGVTEIGFEMKVPPKLPESVDCRDFSVNYQVSVHMECNINNLIKSPLRTEKEISVRDIRIVRLPTTRLIVDDINFMSDFRTYTSPWINYQILVQKKIISLGSDLPITFSLSPKKKGVTIDHVSVQLLESRDMYSNSTHTTQSAHTIIPFVNNKTSIPRIPLENIWEGTVIYKVPSDISLTHSTKKYDDYNISHTLVVHLLISIPDLRKSKTRYKNMLLFKTNVDLLAEIPNERSLIELPPYHSLQFTDRMRCLNNSCHPQSSCLPCYESLAF